MTTDFDKEIDALLRQAARGDDFLNENPPAHVDADEISAFAENALPQTAKLRVTGHLADCAKCRNILANVISLNAETAETIPANEIVEAAIPWYKRFFAFPQFGYAMGALALVFFGVIGILVYQSARQTASFDMARVPASQPVGRGPNAEGEMPGYQDETANMSNMTMANANASINPQISTANTSSNFGVTQSRTFNTNAAAANTARTDTPKRELSRDNQLMFAPPPPKPEKPAEAEVSAQLADESKEERPAAAEKRTEGDVALKKAPAPSSGAGIAKEDSSRARTRNQSREAETRQISGKTFNRKDGVWYDTAYRAQSTTNVRRSTKEYRKLESGLRVIAESLDGVVVVVWKEKAYRIQ